MTGYFPSVLIETRWDAPETTAWPEELAAMAGLPEARRAEYITVRDCARQALACLGVPPTAIPGDARGAPVWPAGIVGSLTHCRGYRAAAVARASDLAALGIDAEPAEALPAGVARRISTDAEFARLAALDGDGTPWGRVLFSAKESIYKAWYPLTHVGLGFRDVDVTLGVDGQASFSFLREVPDEVAGLSWRLTWTIEDGIIKTAVNSAP